MVTTCGAACTCQSYNVLESMYSAGYMRQRLYSAGVPVHAEA